MNKYYIFIDSSSDLTNEMRKRYQIEYFGMGLIINGKEYNADLDFKEYRENQLYDWIKDSKNTFKTSLITMEEFINKMKLF